MGAKEEVSFPELTVFASNINDVEIISSTALKSPKSSATATATATPNSTPNSTAKVSTQSTAKSPATSKAKAKNVPSPSPYATPSIHADQTHTFPSGNARKTLPSEEFDFAANLARFDKAGEFKKIQADDSVPKGDRLVSINSPRRKLGIKESVLDDRSNSVGGKSSVNDEIMEKFEHLTVASKSVSKSSPILVEEGTSSSEDERERGDIIKETVATTTTTTGAVPIPIISDSDYKKFCSDNPMIFDASRTIASVNFAHHLLAELGLAKMIVLLLGVGESSATLMETFYQLCNHGKMKETEILAIFAAGGVGIAGKRIELSASVKQARKKLLAQNRVKFTTSLNDIVKVQEEVVVVFDALGHDGEVTHNAKKGLTEWMRKIAKKSSAANILIYGVESSLLGEKCPSLRLVTFGIARDTIIPSLKVSNSILYVDNGIEKESYSGAFGMKSEDIFSESFVVEIEY